MVRILRRQPRKRVHIDRTPDPGVATVQIGTRRSIPSRMSRIDDGLSRNTTREGFSESQDNHTPAERASVGITTLTTSLPLPPITRQETSGSDKQVTLFDKEDEKIMASSVSKSNALLKVTGELQHSPSLTQSKAAASDLHEIHEIKHGSVSSEPPGRKRDDGATLDEPKYTDFDYIERGEMCPETAEVPPGASSRRYSTSSVCSMCKQGGRQNVRLEASHDLGTSLSNSIKCTIEDVFGTPLAWWPLSSTRRLPSPGYSRVEWEYVSVKSTL